MSRKRVNNHDDDRNNKLEFLGGHIDATDPTVFDGLLRELCEEETSHTLSRLVREATPQARRINVSGTPHHIYEITIREELEPQLTHGNESWGFESIAETDLPSRSSELTPQTRRILDALAAKTGDASP